MNITFDTTAFSGTGLSAADVYVTFAAASSDMVYGSGSSQQSINFSNGTITIGGTSYGTSNAYSLADIAANGLVLNSAVSLVGFISYGSATGIELLGPGTQPNFLSTTTPRYSVFEVSYNGATGGADITNISQFGGSINLAFLSQGTVQTQVGNTLDTTSMFKALAAASGFSGSASTPAVYLDSNGRFVRVVGTNVFPSGAQQNPYPTFNAYLQSLSASAGTNSIVQGLTNLAPGAQPGGTGSVGYPSTAAATQVTPNTIYNLDYHFTAVVTPAAAAGSTGAPDGTYGVTLSGYVNATLAGSGSGDVQSYTYDGLSITIAADDPAGGNLYMTNFIYQAATAGAGINVTTSGWDDLNNDFGTANANAAVLLKAAGDFAQGMTCGFPGSTTPSTSSPGTNLGQLTSYEWWQNPLLAYGPAQTANAYYSAYGNAVSANSGGLNGITFDRGGVYGSPYDDRFGLNLISPDADTDEMCITLLADGDLNPAATSPVPNEQTMANQINVTRCDNELIILAYQGNASFELCRVLSGYEQPVNVTLNISEGIYQGPVVLVGYLQGLSQTIPQYLQAGPYSLLLLGINWGGPTEFAVNVNGQAYELPLTENQDGLVFNPAPIPITV